MRTIPRVPVHPGIAGFVFLFTISEFHFDLPFLQVDGDYPDSHPVAHLELALVTPANRAQIAFLHFIRIVEILEIDKPFRL